MASKKRGLKDVPKATRTADYRLEVERGLYWLRVLPEHVPPDKVEALKECCIAEKSKLRDGFEPMHQDWLTLRRFMKPIYDAIELSLKKAGLAPIRILMPSEKYSIYTYSDDYYRRRNAREGIQLGSWD